MRSPQCLAFVVAAGCAAQGSDETQSSLAQCEDLIADVCAGGVAISAGATESTATPISVGTTYEIDSPHRGYVVVTPSVSGTYTLFSSDDPVRVCDIEASCRSTELACANLDRAARYDFVAGLPYVIELEKPTTLRLVAPASTTGLAFAPARTYPAGTTPWALGLGDLDGDGDLDLAVSTPDDASGMTTVDLLRNDGGDFTMIDQLDTSAPAETALADFNSDGVTDIAGLAVDGQGPLPGFYFVGQGAFAYARQAGPTGYDFKGDLNAADFDEDGTPELVASYAGGFVILDVPAFTATVDDPAFGLDTNRAVAGDFDGDGHQDAIVASSVDGTLRLYRGDGSGLVAFDSERVTPGLGIRNLAAADLDGDGASDVVAIHFDSTITINSLALERSVTAFDVATGDLNGDGLADLAVTGATDDGAGGVAVYFAPSFALAGVLPLPGTSRGVAIGDVDGDGKADLAATVVGGVIVYRASY